MYARNDIAEVVIEALAIVTAVGRYQPFGGGVVGGIDEGYHPAFHDRSHTTACPYPCLYPGLEHVPSRLVNATVTVAVSIDLEHALNRSAEIPNEPVCVRKEMATETEVAEGRGCGYVDHDRSIAAVIGH